MGPIKRFKFPLDTVMDYKQQVLDALTEEYASALLLVHQQEDVLAHSQQEYLTTNEEYCLKKITGLTVAEAMGYQTGLRVLEETIARHQERLALLRQAAQERREQMVEARKDKMSLEKLRERKLDSYYKAVNKQEEQFIDELVGGSWNREDNSVFAAR